MQLQHLTKLVKSNFVQQMEYFLTALTLYVYSKKNFSSSTFGDDK